MGLPLVYEVILETAKPELRAALETILVAAQRNEPVLLFCKLGKDRTGLLSAIVMTCCGVPMQEIVDDYVKSNNLNEVALGGIEKMKDTRGINKDLFSHAPPEAIKTTFQYIEEKYGGVQTYLHHIGFSVEQQEQLAAILAKK